MTKKITKSQLATLQKERDQTLHELENLRNELRTEMEMEDIDDLASDLIEREKTQALIFTLERKLEEVDRAIKNANLIGYGICENCGKPIDPERLEIFPEATLCVDCKRKSERLNRIRSLS